MGQHTSFGHRLWALAIAGVAENSLGEYREGARGHVALPLPRPQAVSLRRPAPGLGLRPLLHHVPGVAVELLLVGGEDEVVRVRVLRHGVQLLLPVQDAAAGPGLECVRVLLEHRGRLHVQRVVDLDFIKQPPSVQEHLPDMVHIPLPLVESLDNIIDQIHKIIIW